MEKQNIATITAEIILGRPSEGCHGHGICRVLTESAAKTFKCLSVTTIISIGADNKLRFAFLKTALSAQAREKHFWGLWFKIEEPLALPDGLQARFQFKRNSIQPGNYPISESAHFYTVTC